MVALVVSFSLGTFLDGWRMFYRVFHPVHQLAGSDYDQHQALKVSPDKKMVSSE